MAQLMLAYIFVLLAIFFELSPKIQMTVSNTSDIDAFGMQRRIPTLCDSSIKTINEISTHSKFGE